MIDAGASSEQDEAVDEHFVILSTAQFA